MSDQDPMDDGGGDRLTAYQRDDLTQHIDARIKALSAAPDERQAGLREALENDIRELRGAGPGEMARRLIERGWFRAALAAQVTAQEERLREALSDIAREWDDAMLLMNGVDTALRDAIERGRALGVESKEEGAG